MVSFVRLELTLGEVKGLLERHAKNYPGSAALEAAGRSLVKGNFDPQASAAFVRRVCEWGRGHRIIGRVLRDNSAGEISGALRCGHELALAGRIAEGVARISGLERLGQSFASKQLRFLAPHRAVILDAVIRSNLGYPETQDGYDEFLGDCQTLLVHAQATEALDVGYRESLRVCDIEAAVFAKIQGY